jgi:PAS domain S-box-containing protein
MSHPDIAGRPDAPLASWNGRAFWAIFENSRLPMSLIDADRRYVAVNDAAVEFYGLPRQEIIGSRPGGTLAPDERAVAEAEWDELTRTGEYYGDRVFKRADGRRIRIQYAGSVSSANGRWLAFSVVLSARVDPDGPELLIPQAEDDDAPAPSRNLLTPREREVVRMVALGAGTRQVAADLYLSPETIRSHVRNAMSKTGAHTRAQLVAIALAEGLIGN